jgi:hypothetical protein
VELIAQTRPEIPTIENITAARGTSGSSGSGSDASGKKKKGHKMQPDGSAPPPSPSPLGTRMVEGHPEPIEPFYIYIASDNEVRREER